MHKDAVLVCFGEILWDLLPAGALPGGAPMNVAYHLHSLGLNPQLITRLGDDQQGQELLEILQEKKLDTSFVQVDQQVPTGVVNASQDAKGDMTYDIVSPAAWDHIEADGGLVAAVSGAEYFISGSLVARSATSRTTLMTLLDHARIKVLDINLRAPHYNQPIVEQLMERADIVKMNIGELELICNWYGRLPDTQSRISFLCDQFKLRSVLVTRGAEGAIALHEGQWAEHPGFHVKVADTVGSGDAFLAGFLKGIVRHIPLEKTVEFACALGSFVATKTGAWPSYNIAEIGSIMPHSGEWQGFEKM